ncbi:MAG: LysM peptidoglycan-binding domain-containing protein [Verrucomicrobiota bacterium]
MKVSKLFGCVLGLHVCIIAVLIVQPGCRTAQPPTQTYTQDSTTLPDIDDVADSTDGFRPTTVLSEGDGLDAAFNAGFDGGNEFSEFDNVTPIEPFGVEQTVDISGPSFKTYTVKRGDSLWSISKSYNVSLGELYAANGLNKDSVLRVGQQIQIPVDGSTATVSSVTPDAYQPTGYNQSSTTYTVRRGDTLSKIAKQYDTTVKAIKAANSKNSDVIQIGETLIIPVGGAAVAPPSVSSATTASSSSSRMHTVKAGEYPAKIAREYGMTTGELLAMNSITDPRSLQVGQQLKVSASGSAANVDSRTETIVAPAAVPTATVSTSPPPPLAEPVQITVVEADPLVEGEFTEVESDDIFDNAVEIPVIRLEE